MPQDSFPRYAAPSEADGQREERTSRADRQAPDRCKEAVKNLASVEEMEHLLMTYVQAVAHLRNLQLAPRKQHGPKYREQLAQAEAEVDDLTLLHRTSPMAGEVQRRLQEVTDSATCLGSILTAFDDPGRFYAFVF
jgi:hypothetical protein